MSTGNFGEKKGRTKDMYNNDTVHHWIKMDTMVARRNDDDDKWRTLNAAAPDSKANK